MELVAFLGNDNENWGQVTALINRGEWNKIILLKNENAGAFPIPASASHKCESITVNSSKKLLDLKKEFMEKLKGKFSEFEASLSVASGNGKEHMALISALLSLPVGIRLVAYTKEGVQMIN